MGGSKPKHPLIGVLNLENWQLPETLLNVKSTSDFYCVTLKDGDCAMDYGRNKYDFNEGVLRFTAPDQVITVTENPKHSYGFMLFFHPDLIRNFSLGNEINRYTFFNYEVHEALHLSEKEEKIMIDCVKNIQAELNENIDKHSQELLVTNLQLILNYSKRFYERQFITRTNSNSDFVSQMESLLIEYFNSQRQLENGIPSPVYFAQKINFSANYLSDLLKKETGKSAKDHIDDHIVELAKTALLNSNDQVSEIAYNLGFNYPHYFGRLFKKKTGETPIEFRSKALN